MILEDSMLSEISQSQKDTCYMIQVAKFIKMGGKMVVLRGWGLGETGRSHLMLFSEMKSVLEIGCKIL